MGTCESVAVPSVFLDPASFFRRGIKEETLGQIDSNLPHWIIGADYSACYGHHDDYDGHGDDQTTMKKRTFQACVHWLKESNRAGIAWKHV